MDPSTRYHTAIDEIAAQLGLSRSGLAKAAGLDIIAFNPSKRFRDGESRWPSSETIVRVLVASGTTMEDFGAFVEKIAAGLD